ncbi:MAG: pirin [Acidobacteriia bacterium]|nr:replication protein RepA [Caldilineaceae bacterium]MYA79001.1 pirin [Terriglobia bacterium]
MERKRGELIPVREVISDLINPLKEIRDAVPQALHHFTRFDQVDQLVEASEADPDMGFMARLMALCSLPRTNPGDRLQYKRVNGPYTLIMFTSGKTKLPFGNLPRLLLAWVCTEAVRTQSRELVLGSSLSGFMRKLGVLSSDSGGKWGIRTRLRNQMRRLFNAHVQLVYEDDRGEATVNTPVASRTELWWDPRHPDAQVLWESKIYLSEEFFYEIISHPVPLDMNTLKALKRSSLGLDLYMWLTYRTFSLQSPLRLSWRQLYLQFGVDPPKANDKRTVQNFRRKVLRELGKIKTAWPDLNYSTAKGVLVLLPSKPVIAPTRLRSVK